MDIYTQIKLNVSAGDAWKIVGEKFGEFGDWVSVLESTSFKGTLGIGGTRICRTHATGLFPASVIEERLDAYNPEEYSYTYSVTTGLPPILKNAKNSWIIKPLGQHHCNIQSHAALELKFWLKPMSSLLKIHIQRDVTKAFEEMGHFIETGEIHPRKKTKVI